MNGGFTDLFQIRGKVKEPIAEFGERDGSGNKLLVVLG